MKTIIFIIVIAIYVTIGWYVNYLRSHVRPHLSMRTVLVVAGVACATLYAAFEFYPEKLYQLVCLAVSLGCIPSTHNHLHRYYEARAARLKPLDVSFQAFAVCGVLFFILCFGLGMSATALVGKSQVELGTVISSWAMRGCIGGTVVVSTESFRRAKLCPRRSYAVGSTISVRFRSSVFGHYFEYH